MMLLAIMNPDFFFYHEFFLSIMISMLILFLFIQLLLVLLLQHSIHSLCCFKSLFIHVHREYVLFNLYSLTIKLGYYIMYFIMCNCCEQTENEVIYFRMKESQYKFYQVFRSFLKPSFS